MHISLEALKAWYQEHREEILQDYFAFLRFPSISADPEHAQDVRDAGEWLCAYLKRIGLQTEIWETCGMPIVFASHKAGPNRPTVLIYHHCDVQPVDPLDLWKNDPFKPEVRNH